MTHEPDSRSTLWRRHGRTVETQVLGNQPAIIGSDGVTMSHTELRRRAIAVADQLTGLGLGPGDLIGAFLPNRPSWIVVALAASRCGVGVIGLNTRFRHTELEHLLAVADIDVVVVPDEFLGIESASLFESLARDVRLIVDADPVAPIPDGAVRLAGHQQESAPNGAVRANVDDPLIGFTTSGTTGFPKIAVHDTGGTVAHLDHVIDAFGLDADSRSLVPLPLCGTFGFITAFAPVLAGGACVLQETWDPAEAVRLMAEHRITMFNGADTMLLAMLAEPAITSVDSWTTGVFADFANAAADTVAVADRVMKGRLPLSGVYGSSEGFALMCRWDPSASASERARNGGRLIHESMSVRACDPETGATLPHGEPGELQFLGPNLVDGYLNNPEASAAAFSDDGWFRSGDLGHTVDADSFVFLARLGDSLRLRGFLCDPSEIEHHLECHPSVDLAQVVGAHRPGHGDVAVAFVRLMADAPRTSSTSTDLATHCRNGLANYKWPEHIVLVDDFPVTDGPNGIKIRKVDLREQAQLLLDQPLPDHPTGTD